MFEYKTGNITAENAEALVNTVNCVGVMGRGVALEFKSAYPGNYEEYARACEQGAVCAGRMFVVETDQLTYPKYIVNFPTKRHWRGKSRMKDIEAGLIDLKRVIMEKHIQSIAVPALGCGLGGLDWKKVRPQIEEALKGIDGLRVIIFEPHEDAATQQATKRRARPRMTSGRAALVSLMDRYLGGLLDPFMSLLEVHKLVYFLKVCDEDSMKKIRMVKGTYGPYAENLTHTLRDMEGHLISGYRNTSDEPDMPLEIMSGATDAANKFLQKHPDTNARVDRVADLVAGFETSFGLELLSTVHWVVVNEHPNTMEGLGERIYAWNDRKRQFSPRQIALAANVLARKGWIEAVAC